MKSQKQIDELMQIASDSMKYGKRMCEVLANVPQQTFPAPRKELTQEQKDEFYAKLHRPYGI